jgi:hypothetical protein
VVACDPSAVVAVATVNNRSAALAAGRRQQAYSR